MVIKLSEKASVWDLDTPSSRMHQGAELHLKELIISVWKRFLPGWAIKKCPSDEQEELAPPKHKAVSNGLLGRKAKPFLLELMNDKLAGQGKIFPLK